MNNNNEDNYTKNGSCSNSSRSNSNCNHSNCSHSSPISNNWSDSNCSNISSSDGSGNNSSCGEPTQIPTGTVGLRLHNISKGHWVHGLSLARNTPGVFIQRLKVKCTEKNHQKQTTNRNKTRANLYICLFCNFYLFIGISFSPH